MFIDPVETGWSRPAPGVESREFTGFTRDVESVGDFIGLWVSRNGRWASPKLIAGESYGTTRAAGLARYLQDRHGMFLNGICLISSVIDWGTRVFNPGHDLPNVLILPTDTATGWYHGKLPERFDGDLRAALEEAEAFALGDYATALLQGDELPPEERRRQPMHENPYLQVLVMSGYYDLATPYFASDYTVTHMSLDGAVRAAWRAWPSSGRSTCASSATPSPPAGPPSPRPPAAEQRRSRCRLPQSVL